MESVSPKILEQAVQLLGNPSLSHDDVEAKLQASGIEEMVARRLASFIPEAFGMVAARHMKRKATFLTTFSADNEKGESEEIPFSAEPIFGQATNRAETMHREGPPEIFETISKRSSVMEVIHDAMEKKAFYDGAIVAIESGVPAEVYRTGAVSSKTPVSFWKELGAVEVGRFVGPTSIGMVGFRVEG